MNLHEFQKIYDSLSESEKSEFLARNQSELLHLCNVPESEIIDRFLDNYTKDDILDWLREYPSQVIEELDPYELTEWLNGELSPKE